MVWTRLETGVVRGQIGLRLGAESKPPIGVGGLVLTIRRPPIVSDCQETNKPVAREWYFVRRLDQDEQRLRAHEFEIQVLDNDGRASALGYLSASTSGLTVGDREIPTAVIEAAKRRFPGGGEYVGPDGQSVPPF